MCDEGIEIKCNFAHRERRMGDWSKAKRYHQRFGLEDIFSFSISVFSISSYPHSFIFLITPLSFTSSPSLVICMSKLRQLCIFQIFISLSLHYSLYSNARDERISQLACRSTYHCLERPFIFSFHVRKIRCIFWILRRSQAEMLRAFWRVFVIFCRKSRLTRRNLHNFVGKSNASSSGTRLEKICYKMHVRK